MSTETQEEMEMRTKPTPQHDWLNHFLGEWVTEGEMMMGPDQPKMKASGREKVVSMGGLWAFTEGTSTMPDGSDMHYKATLGYDVSFNEYRGCWFADVSSHLWKQTGTLSADGKTMTLDCVGPHMEKDGETANYRDIHHIVDENTRTMTSCGQDDEGNWTEFMWVTLKRV
ncbi:DUF1579 domain-containing protein [Kamptonema cortianum]|nr:DUF1579 domain-containing protein [Geitlerinema splendidum]MDK3158644.1 DUF1579 domain-containing protein [Kamptonema cortianum]